MNKCFPNEDKTLKRREIYNHNLPQSNMYPLTVGSHLWRLHIYDGFGSNLISHNRRIQAPIERNRVQLNHCINTFSVNPFYM